MPATINSENNSLKKCNVIIDGKPETVAKITVNNTTIVWLAEDTLSNLTFNTDNIQIGHSVTGQSNRGTGVVGTWDCSGYNYITAYFVNTLERAVNVWGDATNLPVGNWSNGDLYTYLVFSDGTELEIYKGTLQKTLTINITDYSDEQKQSISLKGVRWWSNDNESWKYVKGSLSATNAKATMEKE